jgi:CPA1 family monovalent cation:H+ antiporter
VVAGLLIGNHGRQFATSDETPEHLETFWELIGQLRLFLLFMAYTFVVFATLVERLKFGMVVKKTDSNSILRG